MANSADVVSETKLESVGVCAEQSKLRRGFQRMASSIKSLKLKLLHIRFTGKAERKPKYFKEYEEYADSPSSGYRQVIVDAQQNGATPPRALRISTSEFRISWEIIQGENWREDEEKELEAFANWAFGPNGFPHLRVLASGDFSYGERFAVTHTLWCRNTPNYQGDKKWRTVEKDDIAENELIDANMDMMSACPVSPLFYKYGFEDEFPGLS